LQQSTTVTFENNAPYVTTSINTPSVTFSGSPADYATLTWNSNLSNCSFSSSPNVNDVPAIPTPFDVTAPFLSLPFPQGTLTLAPAHPCTGSLWHLHAIDDLHGGGAQHNQRHGHPDYVHCPATDTADRDDCHQSHYWVVGTEFHDLLDPMDSDPEIA
jgi:hypothetical protein